MLVPLTPEKLANLDPRCPNVSDNWSNYTLGIYTDEEMDSIKDPTVNLIVFIIGILWSFLSIGMFVSYRHEFPIKHRQDFPIVLTTLIGATIEYFGVCFTRSYGLPTMRCELSVLFRTLFVPMFVGGTVIRFITCYSRTAWNLEKAAIEVRRNGTSGKQLSSLSEVESDFDSEVEDVEGAVTSSASNQSKKSTAGVEFARSKLRMMRKTLNWQKDRKALQNLRSSASQKRTFKLLFILSLPSIFMFFLNMQSQFFMGCIGCKLSKQEGLLLGAHCAVFITLSVWYAFRFKRLFHESRTVDSLFVSEEQRKGLLCLAFLAFTWTPLNTIDPGGINKSGKFTYGYILVAGCMYMQYIYGISPVLISRKMKSSSTSLSKKKVVPSGEEGEFKKFTQDLHLDDVLSKPEWLEYFMDHLVNEYASESLKYYNSVTEFIAKFPRRTEKIRWREAIAIYETFIPDDALLQINICARNKEQLDNVFRGKSSSDVIAVDAKVFSESLEEVMSSMSRDSFPRFLKTEYAQILYNMRSTQ